MKMALALDWLKHNWQLKLLALGLSFALWIVLHFNPPVPAGWSEPTAWEPARATQATLKPTEKNDFLASLNWSGGVERMNATVTVFRDGVVIVDDGGPRLKKAVIRPSSLSRLRQTLTGSRWKEVNGSYMVMGADFYTFRLSVPVKEGLRTVVWADVSAHPAVLDEVAREMKELMEKAK